MRDGQTPSQSYRKKTVNKQHNKILTIVMFTNLFLQSACTFVAAFNKLYCIHWTDLRVNGICAKFFLLIENE